jgi:hypothetical protein
LEGLDTLVRGRRGVTVYGLEEVYPMLPRWLSEDVVSLNERGKKYALSMCFRREGGQLVFDTLDLDSVVQVRKVYTYPEGDALPEVKELKEYLGKDTVQELVEYLMIRSNCAAAELLSERTDTPLRRCQPRCPEGEEEYYRQHKAFYVCSREGEHFGLGVSDYTHFTSPLRRYPDLVVHRMLRGRQLCEDVSWLNREEECCRKFYSDLSRHALVTHLREKGGDGFVASCVVLKDGKLFVKSNPSIGQTKGVFVKSLGGGYFVEGECCEVVLYLGKNESILPERM